MTVSNATSKFHCTRSLPLPFAGSVGILAAMSVGETPVLQGGSERLHFIKHAFYIKALFTIPICA